MDLMWAIYWIDVLGQLKDALGAFLIVCAVVFAVSLVMLPLAVDLLELKTTDIWKYAKRGMIVTGVSAGLFVFVPGKNTLYAMMAANVGQQVVESPAMKEIGGKALKILNDKLDELAGDEPAKK